MPVTLSRLPIAVAVSAYAMVITLVVGLASGILAALRQNSAVDTAARGVAMFGISVPNFFICLLMIIPFAVNLGWLPTGRHIACTIVPSGSRHASARAAGSL